MGTSKKAKLEEALSTLSYKTFLQVKDLRNNETNDKENFIQGKGK